MKNTVEARGPLRVFLCHGSEDKPTVREIYSRLRGDGIDPWLDEIDILPGQDWDEEIRRAVRQSDVILVCISSSSASKSGYVQKEIRFALDLADEKPNRTIFIIPVKLEECDIPQALIRWQAVSYFKEDGYAKIVRALRTRSLECGIRTGPGADDEALRDRVHSVETTTPQQGPQRLRLEQFTTGFDLPGKRLSRQKRLWLSVTTYGLLFAAIHYLLAAYHLPIYLEFIFVAGILTCDIVATRDPSLIEYLISKGHIIVGALMLFSAAVGAFILVRTMQAPELYPPIILAQFALQGAVVGFVVQLLVVSFVERLLKGAQIETPRLLLLLALTILLWLFPFGESHSVYGACYVVGFGIGLCSRYVITKLWA
jgi:hypothetical protein